MQTSRSQQPDMAVRIVGGLIIIVLILAFITLYIFPGETERDFAWTIKPPTTAIMIGAGYLAGAYFFVRTITGKRWSHFQAGFLPITAFTIVMLAATFIHWDRFHQGTFIFYLWTVVYIITPLLVPYLWWRNRRRGDGTLDAPDLRFSLSVRRGLGILGVLGLLACLVMFAVPSLLAALTPWTLTPLTGRILAGWGVLAFSAFLSIARDGRWSATRVMLQSWIFAQVLALLALPRIWVDLDAAKPMTYVFVGGLTASLVVCVFMYAWAEARSRRGAVALGGGGMR